MITHRVIGESTEVSHVRFAVSGIDFERDCGDQLQKQGFSVEYTKQSGDFGADIIASKDGIKYALQCKAGQTLSGVKAVQEASSGRQHYRADYAVVVSQSGFTSAASALAASMRVVLLTPPTLADIEVSFGHLNVCKTFPSCVAFTNRFGVT